MPKEKVLKNTKEDFEWWRDLLPANKYQLIACIKRKSSIWLRKADNHPIEISDAVADIIKDLNAQIANTL